MQTRRFNEATIGLLALGKIVELGRQLALAADQNYARKMGSKLGAKPETLQNWATGFVAFDAVISTTGVLGMIQGMRKNRKGAGQAALIQGITAVFYGGYYLLYSLVALKEAKASQKGLNAVVSLAHSWAGVVVYRFARKAIG